MKFQTLVGALLCAASSSQAVLSADDVKTLATAHDVAEPASLVLLGAGLGLLGWRRRYKQRAGK